MAAISIAPEDRLFVLTGAGISAESGIPTFRDAGGLWRQYRIEEVASPHAWRRNPQLVWDFYSMRRSAASRVKPNAGHFALAALEEKAGSFFVPRMSTIFTNWPGLSVRSICMANCSKAAAILATRRPLKTAIAMKHRWSCLAAVAARSFVHTFAGLAKRPSIWTAFSKRSASARYLSPLALPARLSPRPVSYRKSPLAPGPSMLARKLPQTARYSTIAFWESPAKFSVHCSRLADAPLFTRWLESRFSGIIK